MIFEVALFRFRLLCRQKLAWAALAAVAFFIVLSLLTARVSFVKPEKIFWDFSLALHFICQVFLALYFSTLLFFEESQRRTLHLLLSSGLSRSAWMLGNTLGFFFALLLLNIFSFLFSLTLSYVTFSELGTWVLAFQNHLLLAVEILILLFLGLGLSFFMRPLLALLASLSLCALLHNIDGLQRIFSDPQTGRFNSDFGLGSVLVLARLLPPLEWFDLKSFMNYQDSFSWIYCLQVSIVGILWAAFIGFLTLQKFKRMDL